MENKTPNEDLVDKFRKSDRRFKALANGAFIVMFILIIAIFVLEFQAKDASQAQRQRIEDLVKSSNVLARQNKDLGEQIVRQGDRIIFYQKCNAFIIAKFTQNPRVPITVDSIEKCDVSTVNGDGSTTPTQNTPSPPPTSAPTPKKTSSKPQEPDYPPPPEEPEPPLNCTIDLLGLHVWCP